MNQASDRGGKPGAILLATDLSSRCDRALDRAALLARDWGARLIVLSVVPADQDGGDGGGALGQAAPSAGARAEAALAQVRRDLAHDLADVDVVVETGEPAERIEAMARSSGAGLIVTGVARDEPFGRSFAGNTVLRLGRRSTLPVLVVRTRPRPYREILVATDFSASSRQALDTTAALFPDATLTVLHSYEVPFSAMVDKQSLSERLQRLESEAFEQFLADLAPEQRARIRTVSEHESPVRAIWSHMRSRGVDLVVVGSHGRSAVFERFIGSVASQVLENAPGDVLLVRDRRAASG